MVKVALLVGVSEYQPGFEALPSALRDVEEMERILKHPEKGEFDEVNQLLNPTKSEIEQGIYDLFAEREKDDLLLFYFSGHGVKDMQGRLFLTTPSTLKSERGTIIPYTVVAASYLQEQMTDSRSEREVIVLDCCFSGAIAKGLTAKDLGEVDIKAALGGRGRAILTSSTSMQYSFQQDDSGLSVYSHYLIEGIDTGAADLDENGSITADELHQYVSQKVQEASPAMTPQFFPHEEGYRIYIAQAPQGDPKLIYRKEAQKRANKGRFSIIGRRILNEQRIKLGLTQEEATAIETDILRPYQEYLQKLQEYEEAFKEAIEHQHSLSDEIRNELKDYQEILGLRDEDVEPIETKLTASIIEVPQPQPIIKTTESLQSFEFETVTVNRRGEITKRDTKTAQYFIETLPGNVELKMVAIPSGTFLMGTEDEEIERLCKKFEVEYFKREQPQHMVTLQSFFMSQYPVTQQQWKAVASLDKVDRELKLDPSRFKGGDRPVECISWYDAVEFCQRLARQTGKNYRLPSEAEWEYACRAGTTTPFYFGETITGRLANYNATHTYAEEVKGEYRGQTTSVGQFPPNAFRLYDLHGNVWEWCQDDWHENYQGAPTDGSAWLDRNNNRSQKAPMRGGSWYNNPAFCRSTFRFNFGSRDEHFDFIGFRVVGGVG